MSGIPVNEKIIHVEARTELLEKRIIKANQINQTIYNTSMKVRGKDFKRDMSNIVSGKKQYA
jgi:hypothetical protein